MVAQDYFQQELDKKAYIMLKVQQMESRLRMEEVNTDQQIMLSVTEATQLKLQNKNMRE